MASLTDQSVASSYEQLLHVDRDGGGNGTTLVNVKDGDNGTTFALQIATDKISIGATNKLFFDGGNNTYISETSGDILKVFVNDAICGTFRDSGFAIEPTSKLWFDGAGDTYIHEQSADKLEFVVGNGARMVLDDNSRISLSNNDGGDNNTTFGYQAGMNVTTNGDENTFVGHTAGVEVTTGEDNTGIGWRSIFDIKEGGFNTAVGSSSLGGQHGSTADASSENVAIGYSAMGNNFDNSATTDQCVAIGALAMNGALNNVDGTVAVGYKSLNALTSGSKNTAVGYNTLSVNNDVGSSNTAVGYEALKNFDPSSAGHGLNTAVGTSAGEDVSTGTGNTLIGDKAGKTGTNDITTGTLNTVVGQLSGISAFDGTNQTVIGRGVTGQGNNSVTLGNGDVTAVYMGQDKGATIYASGATFEGSASQTTIELISTANNYIVGLSNNSGRIDLRPGGATALTAINNGNVSVTGALSKGSGSFKIDHPLESKKDTHHLVHSFVEAPQADNIYRGKATLSGGSIEINLDTVSGMSEGTFVLLNTDIQCFTSNESDWDAVKGSVSGNILTISCQNTDSTANVSWLVIGERQDDHMKETDWTDENGKVIVEPEKPEE